LKINNNIAAEKKKYRKVGKPRKYENKTRKNTEGKINNKLR
jgi:hypothetical protein